MRGIEAEAKEAKPILRSHNGDLDLETIIPDHFDAQGSAFTSEKMNQARRQHAREKVAASGKRVAERSAPSDPPGKQRPKGQSPDRTIQQIADKYIRAPNDKK